MPSDRRRQEADERRCSRAAERPVHLQGCAGSYPQRLSREFTAKSVREWLGRVGVKTLYIEPLLTIGRMAPSRASFVLLRDELLEREAFDTLLEAKGALRAVAAAHQHDPTAQCLGLPAPGPSRRGSPVRSHGVRLSKRTGLVASQTGAKRITACQERAARRTADRHGVTVLKPGARSGQRINVGCLETISP